MYMKKIIKNKKYLIFTIISVLFLGFMVGFYGYRLVHFYLIENPIGSKLKDNTTLVDTIINKNKIVKDGNGLYFEDDNYIFKGKVDNNYIYYSGLLWRIIKINEDKTIKLVSDEVLTTLYWDNTNNLESSTINNWINDKVLTKLSHQEYLKAVNTCVDVLDNVENKECKKYFNKQKIGLLSTNEYVGSLGKQGFLNGGKSYWLSNSDNNGNMWYVSNDGGVSNINSDGNNGIRPTILLKEGIVNISGDGTIDKPYIIENDEYQALNKMNIGMYLNYNNYKWRVIDKNETSVKVVLDGYLDNESVFDYYTNIFNTNNHIGNYLNNIFYNSLENKEYIVTGDYYTGAYVDYNYQNIMNSKVSSNIGLLSIGDLFVNEYNNILLSNPYEDETMIYTIDNNYYIYGNSITTSMKIRPVLHLDGNLLIKSGKGYKNEPFEIGK